MSWIVLAEAAWKTNHWAWNAFLLGFCLWALFHVVGIMMYPGGGWERKRREEREKEEARDCPPDDEDMKF